MNIDKDTGLTLNNYKEPLKKVVNGYGYYGAVLGSQDGELIQCHICGEMKRSLIGHIFGKHKMKMRDYRETYELAYKTALVSENLRQYLKQNMLDRLASMTDKQRRAYIDQCKINLANGRALRSNFQPKLTLETKNKRGVCPDQLLDKIKEVATKLDRTPSLAEFITETGGQRYKHLIFATFGSWNNALKMLGISNKPYSHTKKRTTRYSDEELLDYLILFYQENNIIPTATDCKRGLIPQYDLYINRFGSFPKARELAGILPSDVKLKRYGATKYMI